MSYKLSSISRIISPNSSSALVDIGLPTIDGYEVASLIALTGYGLAEDRRLSMDAGFDLRLVKLVNFDYLLAAVNLCRRQTVKN